jgi:hypothetical protein
MLDEIGKQISMKDKADIIMAFNQSRVNEISQLCDKHKGE